MYSLVSNQLVIWAGGSEFNMSQQTWVCGNRLREEVIIKDL
jgi:hypothetical protein